MFYYIYLNPGLTKTKNVKVRPSKVVDENKAISAHLKKAFYVMHEKKDTLKRWKNVFQYWFGFKVKLEERKISYKKIHSWSLLNFIKYQS